MAGPATSTCGASIPSRSHPLPAGEPLALHAHRRPPLAVTLAPQPVRSWARARAGPPASTLPTVSRDKDHIALSDEHNSRGIELADRGWLDEAIKEFKKAIELDPNSAHAHDNLATVFAEKKLFREALAEYLTALRLEPDSATAHYNLACFLSTHAAEMAVEEYK